MALGILALFAGRAQAFEKAGSLDGVDYRFICADWTLLKEKINGLMQHGNHNILLNLEDVPYVDSAGLGGIVHVYSTVKRKGGTLKLVNLTKRITDLLAITKLLTVFETYESEADAVSSFTES